MDPLCPVLCYFNVQLKERKTKSREEENFVSGEAGTSQGSWGLCSFAHLYLQAQKIQFHCLTVSLTFRVTDMWQNKKTVNAKLYERKDGKEVTVTPVTLKTIEKNTQIYIFIQSLPLQVINTIAPRSQLKKCQVSDSSHFTRDPSAILIHRKMDGKWHAHALTLVISLLNPLSSNYLKREQKLVPCNYY